MLIKLSKRFTKQYLRSPKKIQGLFDKKLEIFKKDEFTSILNNHALVGGYKGYRSINVTGDWRAIFKEIDGEIIFIALGTHSQLYR